MGVFQIVDAGVVTPADVDMSEYLNQNFRNHYVILNKVDKLNERQFPNQLQKIATYLNVEKDKLITVSAKKSQNVKQILNIMGSLKKIK
jgi:GTP-binding protein